MCHEAEVFSSFAFQLRAGMYAKQFPANDGKNFFPVSRRDLVNSKGFRAQSGAINQMMMDLLNAET